MKKTALYSRILALLLTALIAAPDLALAATTAGAANTTQNDFGVFGPTTNTTQTTQSAQNNPPQNDLGPSIPVSQTPQAVPAQDISVPNTSSSGGSIFGSVLSGAASFFTKTLPSSIGDVFGYIGNAASSAWNFVSGIFGGGSSNNVQTVTDTGTVGQNIVFNTPTSEFGGAINPSDLGSASDVTSGVSGDSLSGYDTLYGADAGNISDVGSVGSDFSVGGGADVSGGIPYTGDTGSLGGFDSGFAGGNSIVDSSGAGDLGGFTTGGSDAVLGSGGLSSDLGGLGDIGGSLGDLGSSVGGLAGGNDVPVNVTKTVLSKPTQGILKATTQTDYKLRVDNAIAQRIARVLVQALTTSIIRWANSGFNGNPSFVTDLKGFLSDVGDQAFGEFLAGAGLSNLCSAFRIPIIRGLTLQFQEPFSRRAACTLSDLTQSIKTFTSGGTATTKVVNVNINNFIGGDWNAGGWNTWYSMVSQDQNNPYSAYLLTSDEAQKQIALARETEAQKVAQGNGYLDYSQCQTLQGKDGPYRQCETVTPGSVIADQVNKAIGAPLDQLVNASEMDEILSQLALGLIPRILSGGLLGISQPSSSGSSSYLDSYAGGNQLTGSTQSDALNAVSQALQTEYDYQNILSQTTQNFDYTDSQLANLMSCYQEKITANTLSDGDKATAFNEIMNATTTAQTKINPKRDAIDSALAKTAHNIETLTAIGNQMSAAQTPQQLAVPSQTFQNLLIGNTFHTTSDVVDAGSVRDTIQEQMDTINQTTATKQAECANFPAPAQQPSF